MSNAASPGPPTRQPRWGGEGMQRRPNANELQRRDTSMAGPGTTSPVEDAIHALKQRLGPRANDTQAVREHHSRGESYHPPAAPDVVCLPQDTDEVADILKISARFHL